jgi:hypothetical protein
MTEAQAFVHAGFTDFVHVDPNRRDGKKRLAWTRVLQQEIVTVRLVAEAAGWRVEYVSPEATEALRHFFTHHSLTEVLAFINDLPAEEGTEPQELTAE